MAAIELAEPGSKRVTVRAQQSEITEALDLPISIDALHFHRNFAYSDTDGEARSWHA